MCAQDQMLTLVKFEVRSGIAGSQGGLKTSDAVTGWFVPHVE